MSGWWRAELPDRGSRRHARPAFPAVWLLPLLIAACTSPSPRVAPRLERLPATQAELSERHFDRDAVLAMVRAGERDEAIVARWQRSEPRLPLRPGDIVELHASGVPLHTLNALAAAHEAALRADLDTRLAAQQAQCERTLVAERSRPCACPAPGDYYWGPRPYGTWGYPPGWRGGMRWGW